MTRHGLRWRLSTRLCQKLWNHRISSIHWLSGTSKNLRSSRRSHGSSKERSSALLQQRVSWSIVNLEVESADQSGSASVKNCGRPGRFFWWLFFGVRVGQGAQLPRLLALYPTKKWRLPEQGKTEEHVEERPDSAGVWHRNYSSVAGCADKIVELLTDEAKYGQVLVLSEADPQRTDPNQVVASLEAVKKDKSGGIVSTASLSTAVPASETKNAHQSLLISNAL